MKVFPDNFPPQVVCADCGFLTVRDDNRNLNEVEAITREQGSAVYHTSLRDGKSRPIHSVWPICFARAWPISEEMEALCETAAIAKGDMLDVAELPPFFREVAARPRVCSDFTPWQQGFTPKEHREMRDREHQRNYEDQLRREVWGREDRRDARADERDKEIQRLQERLHNSELRIIGGLVTVLLLLGAFSAAILEGAITRGWNPSWWPF